MHSAGDFGITPSYVALFLDTSGKLCVFEKPTSMDDDWKISGKGTLPVQIAGIYTGRHAHNNQLAGGNEEVGRLCGEHGIARGKEKYTVARSENTTVVGVTLYYQNQVTPPGQPGPVVLFSARDKAREPSHSGNR